MLGAPLDPSEEIIRGARLWGFGDLGRLDFSEWAVLPGNFEERTGTEISPWSSVRGRKPLLAGVSECTHMRCARSCAYVVRTHMCPKYSVKWAVMPITDGNTQCFKHFRVFVALQNYRAGLPRPGMLGSARICLGNAREFFGMLGNARNFLGNAWEFFGVLGSA